MITYDVSLSRTTLEIQVEIRIPEEHTDSPLLLSSPAWVPGDYEFLPFGRDLVELTAVDSATGASIPVRREGQNSYRLDPHGKAVTVRYSASCYEPEIGDAMGILDSDYAVLMGTRYLFLEGYSGPLQVTYHPPKNWPIHHASGATPTGQENTWIYSDYELLLDTPVVFGHFDLRTRTVRGVPFHYVFVDQGIGYDRVDEFIDLVSRAVEKIYEVFGLFPFEDYTFVLSLNPQADWGLEHLTSNLSGLGPGVFVDDADYAKGIRVCAHELFHAWNVRRLRPAPLGQLSHSLTCGCFTEGLWMAEGFTRYYEFLISTRVQAYSPHQFFSAIVGYFQHLENQPAARRVTATDSSLSSYLNHSKYPGRVNNSIDYYDKGMLIAFGLDARFRTSGSGSLDTAFREFYLQFFGDHDKVPSDYVGYTTKDVLHFFEEIETGLGVILDEELNGTAKLPIAKHFENLGFEIQYKDTHTLGIFFLNSEGPSIYGVANTGAAGDCGIAPEDIINGINGFNYSWAGLKWVASQTKAVTLEIIRGHRCLSFTFHPKPHRKIIGLKWVGNSEQAGVIGAWLNTPEFKPTPCEIFAVDFYENFHGVETMI